MAEPRFADDDDLPRTLRRQREERDRELREREMPAAVPEDNYGAQTPQGTYGAYAPAYGADADDYDAIAGDNGTVTRLKIPFFHLMGFFIKAVLAAIPALILLTVLLWGMGQGLKHFYPELLHFQIKIEPVAKGR